MAICTAGHKEEKVIHQTGSRVSSPPSPAQWSGANATGFFHSRQRSVRIFWVVGSTTASYAASRDALCPETFWSSDEHLGSVSQQPSPQMSQHQEWLNTQSLTPECDSLPVPGWCKLRSAGTPKPPWPSSEWPVHEQLSHRPPAQLPQHSCTVRNTKIK